MATLSGKYRFNDIITKDEALTGKKASITFTAGESTFTGFMFDESALIYNSMMGWSAYHYEDQEWTPPEYQIIDFGQDEQSVSDVFVTWFLDNAKPCADTSIIKAGTYRWNDEITAEDGTELTQDINFYFRCPYDINNYSPKPNILKIDCSQIYVSWTEYDYGENIIRYTVANIEPSEVQFRDKVIDICEYENVSLPLELEFYDNGWSDTYNGGLKTFTIPDDTAVSDKFYNWFNANTKKQEYKPICGVWRVNELITFPQNDILELVNLSVNAKYDDVKYTAYCNWLRADAGSEECSGASYEIVPPIVESAIGITYYDKSWHKDVWGDEINVFDFGTEQQYVTAEFYDWFTANAVPIIKAGTYRFKIETSRPNVEISQSINFKARASVWIDQDEADDINENLIENNIECDLIVPGHYTIDMYFNRIEVYSYGEPEAFFNKNMLWDVTPYNSGVANILKAYTEDEDVSLIQPGAFYGNITVIEDTVVTPGFYEWFVSNLQETDIIKAGTYRWNDELSFETVDFFDPDDTAKIVIAHNIPFISNGETKDIMYATSIRDSEKGAMVYVYGINDPKEDADPESCVVYADNEAHKGWQAEGFKTVTIIEDTEVSTRFWKFFKANTVEQTKINGKWKFNDVISCHPYSKYRVPTTIEHKVEFLKKYGALCKPFDLSEIQDGLYANCFAMGNTFGDMYVEGEPTVFDEGCYIGVYTDGKYEGITVASVERVVGKTVDFGTEPQYVSEEFYNWLLENATPLNNKGAYRFKDNIVFPTENIINNFAFTVKKYHIAFTQELCDEFYNQQGIEVSPGCYSIVFSYDGMEVNSLTNQINYLNRVVTCTPSNPALEEYFAQGTNTMFKQNSGWTSNYEEDNSVIIVENDIDPSTDFGNWFINNTTPAKILKAGWYRFKEEMDFFNTNIHLAENFLYSVTGIDLINLPLSPDVKTTCTDMMITTLLGKEHGSLWEGSGEIGNGRALPVYVDNLSVLLKMSPNVRDWDCFYIAALEIAPEAAHLLYNKQIGRLIKIEEDAIVQDLFELWFLANIEPAGLNICYNNEIIAKLFPGQNSVQLSCDGLLMKDNVKVEINPEFSLSFPNYKGEYGPLAPSEGLDLTLVEGGYEVVGIGSCKDSFLVIPSEYKGLPVVSIGEGAFVFNSQCTNVVLSKNIQTIKQGAFYNCTKLANVDFSESSVETIEYGSFQNCFDLGTLKCPATLKEIHDSAFADCQKLKIVEFNNALESIGSNAFENCKSISTLKFPYGLKTIGLDAFKQCNNIKKISFPNTITSIANGAFNYCSSITELVLPPLLDSLEQSVFAHCTSLEKVVMGDNITAIWRVVFWDCQKLTDIKMSESIEHIHGKAFGQCYNLTNLSMPDSIKYTVGDPEVSSGNLFEGSPKIVFNIKDNVKYLGNDNNPYALLFKSTGGATIQPGTKCIGGYAFKNIPMTSITIPDSVHGISQCAFGGSGLTSIYLPSSIEYLDKDAFADSVEGGGYMPNYTIEDIYVPWSEGAIPDAPWGAHNATIHYNSEV